MTLSLPPFFLGFGLVHQAGDDQTSLDAIGHPWVEDEEIHFRDHQFFLVVLNVIHKLPQVQHTVDGVEVNVKGDPYVDIHLFWLEHPETPDANPILLGKPLHDLLKIGRAELGCISRKELLLSLLIQFDRPAEFFLDCLSIPEILFVFQ